MGKVSSLQPCCLLLLDFPGGFTPNINNPLPRQLLPCGTERLRCGAARAHLSPKIARWGGQGVQQVEGDYGWGGGRCRKGVSGMPRLASPTGPQPKAAVHAGKRESSKWTFRNPVWCSPNPPGPRSPGLWHLGVPLQHLGSPRAGHRGAAAGLGASPTLCPPLRMSWGQVPAQPCTAGVSNCCGHTHR